MAFTVRVLATGDEGLLLRAAEGVFDNPVDLQYSREFLGDPRHHIAVALDSDVVIGFASGVDYIHPDKSPELWINEVGVAPTHRRQGVARKVVEALLDVGRMKNCTNAWVLTDRTNEPAMALYASLGGYEGASGNRGLSEQIVGYSFELDRRD